MSRSSTHQVLSLDGQTAYSSGGVCRVKLGQLQPIRAVLAGVTYLKNLAIAVTGVIDKSSAGAGTAIGEVKAQDLIDRITLRIPGWPHPVYDLSAGGAGSALYAYTHAMSGKRPYGAGAISVTGTGTDDTFYLKLDLPIELLGAKNPGDGHIPIDLLKHAVLEIVWAAAGDGELFEAATGARTNTVVSRVVASLVEKNTFRMPVRFSVQSQELSSQDEELPLAGKTLLALLEVPVHPTAANATDTITNAERTLISLSGDGRVLRSRVNAADLVARWDKGWAQTRDDSMGAHESTAAAFVPIYVADEKGYGISYAPHFRKEPKLVVTGSDTTPRVVYAFSIPTTPGEVVAALNASNIAPRGMNAQNAQTYMLEERADGNAKPFSNRATRLPVTVAGRPAWRTA